MIVCHCNRIDHTDIESACSGICARDPLALLTPVRVYHELGKRPRCGGCLQLAANIIHTRDVLAEPNCTECPFLKISQGTSDAPANENHAAPDTAWPQAQPAAE